MTPVAEESKRQGVAVHGVQPDDLGLVQLGAPQGDVVTVIEGVKAGEKVVVQPGPDVRDGAQVD